jgi:hypothetical protein
MARSDEEKLVVEYLKQQTLEMQRQVEQQQKIKRLQGEQIDSLDAEIAKINAGTEARIEQIEKLSMTQEELKQLGDAELLRLNREIELGRITADQADKKLNALVAMQDLSDEQKKLLREQLETEQKIVNQKQKQNFLMKGAAAASKTIAENIAASFGFGKGLTFQLLKGLVSAKALGKVFKETGKVLKLAFGPIGFLAFGVKNMFQMAFALDKASAQFAATTGAGRQFESSIVGAFEGTSRFGITLDNASKAASDLFVSYAGFTKLSPTARKEFVQSAAMLEKIGVNAQTAGVAMNYLEYSLGQSSEEAGSFSNRMARLATGLGLPAGVLQEQFVGLIPQLSLFGDGGEKAFTKVAKAAKDLGMDLRTGASELFKMVDGFQAFDSAADKVASINLVLGGSFVNTYDMVMAAGKGPLEQLKLLQDAFGAAGKNIDDMGFYERKFLADQLGMSFSNLQKLMKGEITEEEAMVSTQEQLAEAVGQAVTMMDKFNGAIQRLAPAFDKLLKVFIPIIDGFAWLADKGFLMPIVLGGMALGFVKVAGAVAGLGTAFSAAGNQAAVAGAKFKASRALAAGIGMAAGSAADSAMAEGGASNAMRYATGIGQFLLGAALTYFTAGIGASIGVGLMASGGTQVVNTAMGPSPTVSRQGGGTIQKGDSAKVHTGEGLFINPPNAGSEVIDAKTMSSFATAMSMMSNPSSIDAEKLKNVFQTAGTRTNNQPPVDQTITVELYLDNRSRQLLASETVKVVSKNYNPDGSGRMSMA